MDARLLHNLSEFSSCEERFTCRSVVTVVYKQKRNKPGNHKFEIKHDAFYVDTKQEEKNKVFRLNFE